MKTCRICRPKIVVVGGGTGSPVILKSLRSQSIDIIAVATVADDGGSSGEPRFSISNMTPPRDLRSVLVALSDMPQLHEDIFQCRFDKPDNHFTNRAIGNLIIAAVSEMRGSTYEAIQLFSKMMHVDGRTYPSLERPLTLHAVSKDSLVAVGESKIALGRKMVDRMFVTNTRGEEQLRAARKAVEAIEGADMVVLGSGSLFTSILPNLVITEIGEATKQMAAEVAYICSIMAQKGETEHSTDADHVRVLNEHPQARFVDTVLANAEKVPENYMNPEIYDEYLVQVKYDFQGLREGGCRVILADFLELRDGGAFHDGEKVVEELFRIVFGMKY